MKRYNIFKFLILFFFISNIYSKSSDKNLVTSIEIKEISESSVEITWKSNKSNGKFHIYYNCSKVIKDKFVLRDSNLVDSPFLEGTPSGSYFSYRHKVLLPKAGLYYFAVLLDDTSMIDDVAKGIVDPVVKDAKYQLIPEINVTVQPIYILLRPKRYIQPQIFSDTLPQLENMITSLNFEISDNIFKLRWSVNPKDLSKYVFIIYRSKYPLTRFKSPEGLPEYARVTNQFFYEDRNISFETPYYYAVVCENSNQWNYGINVFNQPAVLIKKSPSLQVKPHIEYIKTKKSLPVKKLQYLTEEEIQMAVQQTLENLQVFSFSNNELNNFSDKSNFIDDLEMLEKLNVILANETIKNNKSNVLEYQNCSGKFKKIEEKYIELSKNFIEEILNIRQRSIEKIDFFEKNTIESDYKDYRTFSYKIQQFSQDLSSIRKMEKKMLEADFLPECVFKNTLSIYFNNLKDLNLLRSSIKKELEDFFDRRITRENELREKILEIRKKDNDQMIAAYIRLLNSRKSQKLSQIILLKAQKLNLNDIKEKSYLGSIGLNSKDEIDQKIYYLEKEIDQIQEKVSENTAFSSSEESINQDLGISISIPKLPELKTENQAVEYVQTYYEDLTIEYIVDLYSLPSEKWLEIKENWLQNNKEIWISTVSKWQKETKNFLSPSEYEYISSKWLFPSHQVCLIEGKNAFNSCRYKEALYLLNLIAKDPNALMFLGKSCYELSRYKQAFSIFVIAVQMEIPESRLWLQKTTQKLLNTFYKRENL